MQTWSAKVKGEARLLLTNAVTAPAFRLEISDAGVVRAGQEIEQRRIEEAADDHANDDRQRRDDQSVTQLPQMLEERHRAVRRRWRRLEPLQAEADRPALDRKRDSHVRGRD